MTSHERAASAPPGQTPAPPQAWRSIGMAAGLVLIVVLAAYAALLRAQLGDAFAALEDTTSAVAQLSTELGVAREDADLLVDTLGVLGASDLVRVDLRGAGTGAGAGGRAFVSPSRGIVLHATNLPVPGPRRTYQVWALAGQGPSGIGTFDVNAFGSATVTRLLPAGTGAFTSLAVTDEPMGGSPGPTTTPVLAGALVAN